MKPLLLFIFQLILTFTTASGQTAIAVKRGDNGGVACATCTILLSISSQLAQIYNETTVESLTRLCTYLPVTYQDGCDTVVTLLAPIIGDEVYNHLTVDTICYSIRMCYVDPGKSMCHLFPLPLHPNQINFPMIIDYSVVHQLLTNDQLLVKTFPWICYVPGVYYVCQALANTYSKLLPSVDFDGDKHSPAETLRGSIWRGRDCADLDGNTRPGRRSVDGDRYRDSNCNGIFGLNGTTGLSYEDELCAGSGQRGLIYIGDSVGAHFHVPPAWFTPALLDTRILTNISYVISNEFDWPDVGFSTGYRNATYMPDLLFDSNVDSIYLRLRKRNLCNHRDYQNLARNGASSLSSLDYMKSLGRDKWSDLPALVIYSMVGNDVCNEKMDTVAHMTSPGDFYKNVMKTLRFLEKALPPNSHIVLVGLIDGSILYKAMAKRYHPLGELRKDLTFDDVYQWFNCMEIGPCHGWMSSNATLRKMTTRHARKLSQVLQAIAQQERFITFDVHYVPNPFQNVIDEWKAQGREVWELIEPVDSLHPTQKAQPLIAESLWTYLETYMPFVLGPINERNDQIKALFGQQGGH